MFCKKEKNKNKNKKHRKNEIAKSVIRPSLLVTRLLADEIAVFKFPCVFSAVLMGIPRTTPRSENNNNPICFMCY